MTYRKPEIMVVGDAAKIIQGLKPPILWYEPTVFVKPMVLAAYELDE